VAELRRRHGVARTRPSGGRGGAPPPEELSEGPAQQDPAQGPAQDGESTEQMSLDLGAAPPRKAPARTAIRSRPR